MVNKVYSFLAAVLFFLLSGLTLAGGEKTLTVIQTADLHGNIAKNRIFRTAELIRRVTEESGGVQNSIRIDCGDLFQGSYAMTFAPCRQAMTEILNELQFDVFVPGNHDLDFGIRNLEKVLLPFRGTLLGANWQWKNFPGRKDYVILHRNGLKVAVIGLGYHHAAAGISRPAEKGLIRTLPARRSLQKLMPSLMKEKPHIILLALHAGEYTRLEQGRTIRDLVREFPQIDLVLSAHSHQECRGAKVLNNTVRIQAPALGKGIAVARLVYDTEKYAVRSLKTEIISLDGNTPVHSGIFRSFHSLNRIVRNSSRKPVGNIPFELSPLRRRTTSNVWTELCGKAIAKATGAEIVFYTPASRFRKTPGTLTEQELFLLIPHEESAGVLDLTADECKEILSEQFRNQRKGYFQAPYGFRFQWKRSRVTTLTFPGKRKERYRCAFSDYALSGAGGRFPLLKKIAEKQKIPFQSLPIRDLLRNYIAVHYPAD